MNNKPSPMAIVSMACGIASVTFCWAGFCAVVSGFYIFLAIVGIAAGIVALIMSGKGQNGAHTSSVFCKVGKITGLIGMIIGAVALTVGFILIAVNGGRIGYRYYW